MAIYDYSEIQTDIPGRTMFVTPQTDGTFDVIVYTFQRVYWEGTMQSLEEVEAYEIENYVQKVQYNF